MTNESKVDATPVLNLLAKAEEKYHDIFKGRVPDEVHRFEQFLNTVRMIVDQSADRASKGE